MTKKQDPYALPATGAARARQQQLERRKAQRAAKSKTPPGAISRRFLAWALGGAAVLGLLAFSLAWPKMPLAAYVGLGVAVGWVVVAFGLRAFAARNPARP